MRRRFARRMGRPGRGPIAAGIPPLLVRSNQYLARGRFAEAAEGLEQMARAAEARGGRRAAMLFLEAGRARLLSGEKSAGVALLQRGLALLAAAGASLRLARASSRVIAELSAHGMDQEAEQIRQSMGAQDLSALESAFDAGQPERRPRLPTHCPSCGAPVRADEVEWVAEDMAECEFCGTPMRPEQPLNA